MEITKEIQDAYVESITKLFGGAVRAYPEQINAEVIGYVDQMFAEITTCHQKMAVFAIPFQTISNILEGVIPAELRFIFGSDTLSQYILDRGAPFLINKLSEFILPTSTSPTKPPITPPPPTSNAKLTAHALSFMLAFVQTWIDYTKDDRRLVMCINVARANWRSKVQIALLGI